VDRSRRGKEAVVCSRPDTLENRDRDVVDVLVVLLLVQGTIALLSAVGFAVVVVVAGMLGAAGALSLLAAGYPILLLILAAGVANRRPWARYGAVVVESVALITVNVALLLDRLPQVRADLGLAGLLANVCLPVLVIALAMSPAVERGIRSRLRRVAGSRRRAAVTQSGMSGTVDAPS
jgi:hypothetical protein